MKQTQPISIRQRLTRSSLLLVAVTILMTLTATIPLTLRTEQNGVDLNLSGCASLVARLPTVAQALTGSLSLEELDACLTDALHAGNSMDAIAVADPQGTILYATNPDLIGTPLSHTDADSFQHWLGMRSASAQVMDQDGQLLGYVAVGLSSGRQTSIVCGILLHYLLITALVSCVALLLSVRLSRRIKTALMGYEPDAFRRLFHQREDILEALEEGIIAIDRFSHIIYLNQAAARMLGLNKREEALNQPLHQVYPGSQLPRLLETGRAEYNVSIQCLPGVQAISDRMPIREDGAVVGAVAIFRNRTELYRMAEDLTGVRHMVEAMRAYTHEFMNKLHVILGLIQIGRPQQAQEYIMDVTSIHQKAVSLITDSIRHPSVAALLVGKTSRCAELGIRLTLRPGSCLDDEDTFLPIDAHVTILGNLIENAVEALNQTSRTPKEIVVTLREDPKSLLICVEDTGPGMEPAVAQEIFRAGFSTKGEGRGTGLALVREVVDAYQGEMRVESEPGSGTAFFITFRRELGKE